MSETRTDATSPTPPGLISSEPGRPSHPVDELIGRSNRLGATPRNTNYAGGNTSAKGSAIDPVTGRAVELLWVKGSGGDLGTLTEAGLAVLRLDRVRALVEVYPGVEREDEMVAAFDHCLFGRGGAAPSIDTAMHGLTDAAHVDHLHPDSGIALATAADGEALTRACFGDRVAWVPWRRPGFQLALDIAAIRRDRPDAIGTILGGHGITAWGTPRTRVKRTRSRSSGWPRRTSRSMAERSRSGRASMAANRYRQMPAGSARPRSCRSSEASLRRIDRRSVTTRTRRSCSTSSPASRCRGWPRSGPRAPTISCGPRSARWSWTWPRTRHSRTSRPAFELHAAYRDDYRAYYDRHATPDSPPMRGADPAIVLVPGVGMFSFGATSRRPGSRASSTSTPST